MPALIATPPGLARSRALANLALISAACLWVLLLLLEKFLSGHAASIGILAMSAEAGVVGGLADWYAVTVLFRNPFGRLPLPRLMREHTEIIPRNKARIAESMGRFVQENFLAAPVVRKSLRNTDASLMIGRWLTDETNIQMTTDFIQRTGPRLLQVFENRDISAFIQQNVVAWARSTPLHLMTSEVLRAILENDFHHEILQRALDAADRWIKKNPEKARAVAATAFEELGVGSLARGASWIGIDVQQRTINSFMIQVENLLENRDHPWRQWIEKTATKIMKDLRKKNSSLSKRLNATKNALTESESVISFVTSAVVILREAVKRDLERVDSSLADNFKGILTRLGEQLQRNERVRTLLNHEIEEVIVTVTTDYADAIINYVSAKIHDWDTREMIAKIETEVGGDLHMIRVNGVVVGAFIGLLLGLGRLAIDYLNF